MTRHFDYCPSASEGDNQSVGSSAPVVSRCFPGGYNVKLCISRGMISMVVTGFFAQCGLFSPCSAENFEACAYHTLQMCSCDQTNGGVLSYIFEHTYSIVFQWE